MISILGAGAAKHPSLDQEALEFARQNKFIHAMIECSGLWYLRHFKGNPDRVARYDWETSNQWVMEELKNVTFKVMPYYIAETNYIREPDRKILLESDMKWVKYILAKERNIEWIGDVRAEAEARRTYFAQSRTWESSEHKAMYTVSLRKWAGQWVVYDTFRHFAYMPKLSCNEVAALRK